MSSSFLNSTSSSSSPSVTWALEKMLSKSHADEVALMNRNVPIFLPWQSYILAEVIPAMLLSALFLTIVHVVAYLLLGRRQAEKNAIKLTPQQRHLISYRITNFVANTCLSILGLYYCARLPPLLPPHNTIPDCTEMHLLGSFQMGYQLWALPVGMYVVQESSVMLFHHFAVMLVSIMSTMFTHGFRYWTPYFYGIFELSSIPLALMNAFKDHKDWMDAYPGLYLLVRLLFAVTFLGVRIVHCSPRHVAFLIEHYYLWSSWSSHNNTVYMIYMAIVWICSTFLLLLNLYWGTIIFMGLVKTAGKMMFPKKQSPNKQKRA